MHMLQSKDFLVCFLKKGSLIYVCFYNTGKRGPDGDSFLDERDLIERAMEFTEQSEASYLRTFE